MQANAKHSHNIQHMTSCSLCNILLLVTPLLNKYKCTIDQELTGAAPYVQHTAVGNPTFKQVQMYYRSGTDGCSSIYVWQTLRFHSLGGSTALTCMK